MSGLPASGKDHWLNTQGPQWPRISLDEIRAELGVRADQPQRTVVEIARERARTYLRAKQPFIWNATNLSRKLRGSTLDLLHDYHAKVHVVMAEATPDQIRFRNSSRPEPVPEAAIRRMQHFWEPPDITEAHKVTVVRNE
jgi:predicted kinase